MENYIKELLEKGMINTESKFLIMIVIVLCSVDVITGVVNAGMEKQISSNEFKKGAIGKTYELLIIGLSIILDKLFKINYLYISTCVFYIILEVISILENTSKYVSYPAFIKEILNKFIKKEENENGKQ